MIKIIINDNQIVAHFNEDFQNDAEALCSLHNDDLSDGKLTVDEINKHSNCFKMEFVKEDRTVYTLSDNIADKAGVHPLRKDFDKNLFIELSLKNGDIYTLKEFQNAINSGTNFLNYIIYIE